MSILFQWGGGNEQCTCSYHLSSLHEIVLFKKRNYSIIWKLSERFFWKAKSIIRMQKTINVEFTGVILTNITPCSRIRNFLFGDHFKITKQKINFMTGFQVQGILLKGLWKNKSDYISWILTRLVYKMRIHIWWSLRNYWHPLSRTKTKDLFINVRFYYFKVFHYGGPISVWTVSTKTGRREKLNFERDLEVTLTSLTFLRVNNAISRVLSFNSENRWEWHVEMSSSWSGRKNSSNAANQ